MTAARAMVAACEHSAIMRGMDGRCILCPPVELDGARAVVDTIERDTVGERPCPSLDEIESELCRRDLREFVRAAHASRSSKVLLWAPHLDAFCLTVQAMADEWLLLHGCFDLIVVDPETGRTTREDTPHKLEVQARVEAAWALHGLKKSEHQDELLAQNVTINAPPMSLKSEIVMVYLPAWAWLHCPWLKFGCASGVLKNVTRDSDAMRDLVAGSWYRESFLVEWLTSEPEWEVDGEQVDEAPVEREPGDDLWTLRNDIAAKGKWANTNGGERQSVTMHQGFTGQHVHWILLDDPDDPERAWSDTYRERIRDRWARVFENRVDEETTALRMIVQQQVHPEDLSNHVRGLSSWSIDNRMGWAWLCIALIKGREPGAYPGITPWGWRDLRHDGENMQPERFPERVIADKRRKLGTHGFESQYNQNSAPVEGGWFKRTFMHFFVIEGREPVGAKRPKGCSTESPFVLHADRRTGRLDLDEICTSIDASFGSTSETASAVGLITVGIKGPRRFCLEDDTDVMTDSQMMTAIRNIISRQFVTRLLIELKANGQSLVQRLTQELQQGYYLIERDGKPTKQEFRWPDGSRATVVVEPWSDVRDTKPGRARTMLAEWEAGLVHLAEGAPWLERHVGEISSFPDGRKKNDRVDSWSQLMTKYRGADTIQRWRALAGQV